MEKQLKISIGEYSTKGRKEVNQDFHENLTEENIVEILEKYK